MSNPARRSTAPRHARPIPSRRPSRWEVMGLVLAVAEFVATVLALIR